MSTAEPEIAKPPVTQPEPIIPKPPVTQQGAPIIQPSTTPHAEPSAPSDTSAPAVQTPEIPTFKKASYSDKVISSSFKTVMLTDNNGNVTEMMQDKETGVFMTRKGDGD